jgi:transposase-like protein
VEKNGGRLTNKKEVVFLPPTRDVEFLRVVVLVVRKEKVMKVMATLKSAKTSKRKKEDDKKKINK